MSVAEATQPKDPSASAGFEPRIVAFVCKWCTYAGADLAGTSRMPYASNVRTLMLPCTGRIDISFVIRAFLQGADGVLVSGCHPGDCHYTAGNFRARRRWTILRDLLDTLGFDLRCLNMAWISAAEGVKWVKTIQAFTDKVRELGPYQSLHTISANRTPAIAPAASAPAMGLPPRTKAEIDTNLVAAATDALQSGKVKAVVGWTANATLGRHRPLWITSPEEASKLLRPADEPMNLARFLKNPGLQHISPIGLVARPNEVSAINVLLQEAQVDPARVVIFAIATDGKFLGTMDAAAASSALVAEPLKALSADRPAGFSEAICKSLDDLMAKKPQERWAYWSEQFSRCLKCYACRGSCPMCNCDQCFADKNNPQWFPTAADGPGNLAWHIVRAFHLAGRCVGCGACQAACPAGIPINILGAAVARSSLKHFGHRAGADPAAIPLQSDFRTSDREDFIL